MSLLTWPTLGGERAAVRRLPRVPAERTGAAAVEFALLAPLFLLFVAGIVECGQAFRIEHSLDNACRRAARSAITPGSTSSQVIQEARAHCANLLGVDEADVSVTISVNGAPNAEIATANASDEILVSVSLPFSEAGTGFFSKLFDGATLEASCIMERE